MKVKVPTLLWYGDKNVTLTFPSKYDVQKYPMNGANKKSLNKDEIQHAFLNTINTKTIRGLANNHKEAVILFDDISRPTPIYQLVPYVLKELNKGGISNDHIRFISALGAHGVMDREDFVKKLGESIVEEFSVFNHNPFNNLTEIGTTSRGTPVQINDEVMACDLKIGIGSVVPHGMAGFGGGAKILLPGVASYDTICTNHKLPTKWGIIEGNVTHLDMEEAAKMAGLDVKVDVVLNGKAQIAGLYVGDVVDEFREAVKLARNIYTTSISKGFDIVVANAYFKPQLASITIRFITEIIKNGGTAVIIANDPKGQINHYLEGKFGKDLGGPFYKGLRQPEGIGRVIIFSPYKMRDPWHPLFDPKKQLWLKNWKEVLEELRNIHGDRAKVAIIPHATVQIP